MDKQEIQIVALSLGAVGTIALVYFAYMNSQNTGNGGDADFVTNFSYPIVTSAPVDSVGIANAQVSLATAELASESSMFGKLVDLVLGKDTNATNLAITEIAANAQIEVSENDNETLRYQAGQNSQAIISAARYNYEATRQQEKTKRNQSVGSTIGSIVGSILRLF